MALLFPLFSLFWALCNIAYFALIYCIQRHGCPRSRFCNDAGCGKSQTRRTIGRVERVWGLGGGAPDQFDPKFETSRFEIWAYYAYYIGDNGLTLFNFAPTAFQNLLYQAAGDSTTLLFMGQQRTINSIVLLSNGISFAIQIVLFLIIGSYAGKDKSMNRQ